MLSFFSNGVGKWRYAAEGQKTASRLAFVRSPRGRRNIQIKGRKKKTHGGAKPGNLERFVFHGLISLAFLLFVSGCGGNPAQETVDPYEGMVQVHNGAGGLLWVPLYEDMPVFGLDGGDFFADGRFIGYSGEDWQAVRGIDVSFYQGDIDWESVRADGIEFAMIRAGFRGYSEGEIYEDERFREYAQGALAAGIEIGAYFFSQALDVEEAREEARRTLEIIGDFNITYPVAFDWEDIDSQEARTNGLPGSVITDCAIAFSEVIAEGGYEPAVYFYRTLGYIEYELPRLAGLTFWVGAAGDYPDFYYDHQIWQYSFTGRVDGIDHDVDLNLKFVRKTDPQPDAEGGAGE